MPADILKYSILWGKIQRPPPPPAGARPHGARAGGRSAGGEALGRAKLTMLKPSRELLNPVKLVFVRELQGIQGVLQALLTMLLRSPEPLYCILLAGKQAPLLAD